MQAFKCNYVLHLLVKRVGVIFPEQNHQSAVVWQLCPTTPFSEYPVCLVIIWSFNSFILTMPYKLWLDALPCGSELVEALYNTVYFQSGSRLSSLRHPGDHKSPSGFPRSDFGLCHFWSTFTFPLFLGHSHYPRILQAITFTPFVQTSWGFHWNLGCSPTILCFAKTSVPSSVLPSTVHCWNPCQYFSSPAAMAFRISWNFCVCVT